MPISFWNDPEGKNIALPISNDFQGFGIMEILLNGPRMAA